jgi:hypothetical protein
MRRPALIIIALALSTPARADSPRTARAWLTHARAEWKHLEYERVIDAARAARTAPGATPRLRAEAFGLEASAQVVMGDEAAAATTFASMFAADPSYELPPGTSPRVLAIYRPARSAWDQARETALREQLGPKLQSLRFTPAPPPRARGGLPITVAVDLTDPDRLLAQVRLHYRRGTSAWSTLSARLTGRSLRVDIPGAFTASEQPYRLELFAEAVHASGVVLRRAGTREQPLAVAVDPGQVPRPTPLYKRWWVWAGAGALAIGVPILIQRSIDVGPQDVTGRPR